MNIRRLLLMVIALLGISSLSMPAIAQTDEPISLTVEAGFNNFYRPGYWLPLQIQVGNQGIGFSGRLTVRPETSGRAVNSAYSVPIDLPTGSEKTVFLYMQAQASSGTVIVELLDDEGVRVADQAVGLTAISPDDTLHMTVSAISASSIPLNSVAQAGTNSRQGRWQVDNLPPDVSILNAIDTLLLYDVQSDTLTIDQLQALEAWVTMGGHLIVIGGPNWAQTTAGLPSTLLPLIPDSSQNIEDISALSAYINRDDALDDLTFITTGSLADDASVRAATDDDLPLLVRRELGLGVVDFLTVDPTLEPLRSWDQLGEFWQMVISDLPPEPGWQRGILDLQDAARSIAILPNVELLPPASSMILFILAYILIIGPINYIVLSRLRRRAWAWATIPLLIVTFTLLAWNVGFNLRGNDLIVSRLYVVQSFPNSDLAYQDELVGVLSPRRDIYSIEAPADTIMGFLPGVEDDSLFSANVTRSTSDILQGQTFSIEDIAIDGGIFANFHLTSVIDAPAISGSATIGYIIDEIPENTSLNTPTSQSVRGVIRNDSDMTLEDVVIFARNRFYRVEDALAAGDVLDFDTNDFDFINDNPDFALPIAAPIESRATYNIGEELGDRRSINDTLVTGRVLLNLDWSTGLNRVNDVDFFDSTNEEQSRRRALLRAFMRDQNSGLGIGNQVYVMGWSNETQADDITVADTTYRTVDTTLHIIEIDTAVETPSSSEQVTLSADQFTWAATDFELGQVFGNLSSLTVINPAWAEFQITPLEGAILETVSTMIIEINRGTALGSQVEFSLYNRVTGEWDIQANSRLEEYIIDDPAPYLGRNNMVDIRFEIDTDLTSSNANGRVLQTRIIQIGNF